MRILFLSTENPFPVDHGHHIRTYHTLKSLSQRHEIHFVAFSQNQAGFENQDKLEEICTSVLIRKLKYSGRKQAILALKNFFSREPLVAQKYFDAEVAEEILRIVRQRKIDLVHFDMLHLAKYRSLIESLPCVLVNHNVESLRLKRWADVESNPLLRYFLKYQQKKLLRFEKESCSIFSQCIVVSDFDKDYLQKLCRGQTFLTVPNGVDCEFFHANGGTGDSQNLVWTGSMSGPYNRDAVRYFIGEIWPLITAKVPDAKITFVGAAPPAELQNLANDNQNVIVAGYVDDVRPYVANANVFVAPLRAGSGTKIKVLNAMAQAKAVVTTSVGAEGIEAHNEYELLLADRAEAFAAKTIHLLQNPQEAKEIGLRARKLVEEKYDWKVVNRKMMELYDGMKKNQLSPGNSE